MEMHIKGDLNPVSTLVTQDNFFKVEVFDSDAASHTIKVGSVTADTYIKTQHYLC